MAIDGEYAVKVLKQLSESENSCDRITLVSGTDNQRFPIDRSILVVSSKFFEAKFESNASEVNDEEFTLDDADGATAKMMVDFCYTGHIDLTEENVEKIVVAAVRFKLDLLEAKCRQFYNRSLSVSSSVHTLMVADQLSFGVLRECALDVIRQSFHMLDATNIQKLTPQMMEDVLKSNKIEAPEEFVFTRLLEWYKCAEVERSAHMPLLLQLIRLDHITPAFLNDTLVPVYNQFHCFELVNAERERRASNPEVSAINRSRSIWCVQETFNDDVHSCSIKIWKHIGALTKFESVTEIKITDPVDMGLIVYQYKIYMLGGKGANVFSNSVQSHDLITNERTILPSMNVPRERFATVLCGKYIYVFGGVSYGGVKAFCERFDTESNSWEAIKPMKVARYWSSAAVLNGRIYVVGGVVRSSSDNGFEMTDAVEMYDPNCDEWVLLASMRSAKMRHTLVASNGILFAFAGYCEKYEPLENRWTAFHVSVHVNAGVNVDGDIIAMPSYMQIGKLTFGESNKWFPFSKSKADLLDLSMNRFTLFHD